MIEGLSNYLFHDGVRWHCPHRTNSVHSIQQLMTVNILINMEKLFMYMIFIALLNLAWLMLSNNRKRISPKSLPKPNFGWVLFCLTAL
jgi:hypothetical protein